MFTEIFSSTSFKDNPAKLKGNHDDMTVLAEETGRRR